MQFSIAALLVAATGAVAMSNVTYTTEVVTAYTTYCPGPTQVVHGDKTYTVTSAGTLTITDCPCTISKPVITTSKVVCHDCGYNATMSTVKPTGYPTTGKPPVATAGAVKGAVLSGAGLAGVLGFAALVL